MAPELFTGNYNDLVDIYSFGWDVHAWNEKVFDADIDGLSSIC